jgi:hypothetical protein
MELGYEVLLPDQCGLRKFLSRFFVFITLQCFEDPIVPAWNADKMGPVHRNNEELWKDTFALMRGQSGLHQKDPRTANPCDYHFHEKEEKCDLVPAIKSSPAIPPASVKLSMKRKSSN